MAKLLYDGRVITTIMTNHSMSIDEMLALNEIDANDPMWDYELFAMDWSDD